MRSFLLIIASLFLFSMAYLAYWWIEQPSQKHQHVRIIATSQPKTPELANTAGGGMVGPGKNAWLEEFSSETGKITNRFRTLSFVRLPDGRFSVQKPVAEFWTWSGEKLIRIVQIEGTDGTVTTTHRKQEPNPLKGRQMDNPSSGDLHNVVLRIFEPDATGPLYPEGKEKLEIRQGLCVTMNNASFDNETFRISTQAYTDEATDETIPGDMVPVHGVGDDNHPDFDGKGLTLKWNDRDRRLDLLELAHGQKLVIKHARNVMHTESGQPAMDAPRKTLPPTTLASAATQETSSQKTSSAGPTTDKSSADASEETPTVDAHGRTPRHRRPHMPTDDDSTTNPSTEPTAATEPAPPTAPETAQTPTPGGEKHTRFGEPDIAQITPTTAPPLYRATFSDSVRIVQGDQTVIKGADQMKVDFMLDQGQSTPRSASPEAAAAPPPESATSDSAADAAAAPASDQPRRASRRERGDDSAAAGPTPPAAIAPAAAPTTRPSDAADQPVTVYWTGKLVVAPLTATEDVPPGQSIIRFEGNPVVAKQGNSELRSTHLSYYTQDSSVVAQATPKQPVIMTSVDERGGKTVIQTQELNYWRWRQMAVLRGKGQSEMPPQNQGPPLKADWTRSCTISFSELPEGRSAISHVTLDGDANVNHPQIKLNADQLDLAFDPPTVNRADPHTAQPAAAIMPASPGAGDASMQQAALRQLIATGKSHCELTGADKKTQVIDSNRLTVQMAQGPNGRYPRTVNADGDVHAVDSDQDMHAGSLAVELRPGSRPAGSNPPTTQNIEVQSMTALDNVVVVTRDGTMATAGQLLISVVDGKSTATLLGQPGIPAEIVAKETNVTGPTIVLNRDQERMEVVGAGHMHGLQQETPGSGPRPMDVTWTQSCIVNSKDNLASAFGQVHSTMRNADGSVDQADAQRVEMKLADVAAPATHPAASATQAAQPPSTHPAISAAAPAASETSPALAMAGKKTVRQAIFYDGAKLTSTLLDAKGSLLKRTDLEGDKIQYDVLPNGQSVQKRLTVFGEGRMLMEDYRNNSAAGANTDPGVKPANPGDANDDNGHGVTVFRWSKQMVYDDQAKTATLDGTTQNPVVIVHGPQADKPEMRLTGDKVVADLEPLAAPTTLPASGGAAPATRPAEGDLHFQVKLVTISGHVDLHAHESILNAVKMTYDPQGHMVKAYGNDDAPAMMTRAQPDQRGSQPIRGDELDYNIATDQMTITHPVGDLRR